MLGKPKQDIGLSGGIVHAHVRDPRLAALSKEELDELASAYDKILLKHSTPVLDAPQDGPQNQIESSAAIEGEVMESGAGSP